MRGCDSQQRINDLGPDSNQEDIKKKPQTQKLGHAGFAQVVASVL